MVIRDATAISKSLILEHFLLIFCGINVDRSVSMGPILKESRIKPDKAGSEKHGRLGIRGLGEDEKPE